MNENTPICYPYLAGYFEQSMRSLTHKLSAQGLIANKNRSAVEKLIEDEIKRGLDNERKHSAEGLIS